MREMIMSEQPRKPYNKPSFTHYGDIRTFTLGASTFPGESGGFEADSNPRSADTGEVTEDIFE